MNESAKASRRRFVETYLGEFDWSAVFKGNILDVGAGNDPLPYANVTPWDVENGDANKLSNYFKSGQWQTLHGSQVIEHMHNPKEALKDWSKVVAKGGHIVLTFPAMELYGDVEWSDSGSKFNPDHKATFSMRSKKSQCKQHIYVPDWVKEINKTVGKVILSREIKSNYDEKVGYSVDQTWPECDMVEAFIELVIKI